MLSSSTIMSASLNSIADRAMDSITNSMNSCAIIPNSMMSFVETEKIHLAQIATNFLARHFEFRTKDRDKKLNVVQLMSEYDGNFSTPVCYLQFYLKRAGKIIRFCEEIGPLSGSDELNRLNCIRIYREFLNRYTDLIVAIQSHAEACEGRLFRRSIERMEQQIAHVPINLHLQQLLVSSANDLTQKTVYNTITLGAPAVHHSRFTNGGLRRMKTNFKETNKRLCYLQDKLQQIFILNSDVDDAIDQLMQYVGRPLMNTDHSMIHLYLQRVIQALTILLDYSNKELNASSVESSGQVLLNPMVPRTSTEALPKLHHTILERAKQIVDSLKQLIEAQEQTIGMAQLNELKLVASELDASTCKHVMRHIFQENPEIERYPQFYRERFDIAFSQVLTCLIFSISVLLSTVKINDQAWKLYIDNGELH